MIIKKDYEIVKAKEERKSLALKAKKESSDEVCSTSGTEDEEYTMAVRDFKKFFKRIECPKPPKDKNQRAFVRVSWSDSGEEDDRKVKDETCLLAQASHEVLSESSYFSDESSSKDDLVLDNEYDKLCKMSLKIITKNKRLKATRNSLEKELSILKEKVSTLEKNKGVDLEQICDNKFRVTFSEHDSEITKDGKVIVKSRGNSKLRVIKGNSSGHEQDGKDKNVISKLYWSSQSRKKAQEERDFTLLSLKEQAQTSHQWIACLAIRVSDHMIQGP
ncbi:hypothetical protein Tco_0755523 [Tanacetum coccineum]